MLIWTPITLWVGYSSITLHCMTCLWKNRLGAEFLEQEFTATFVVGLQLY